MDITETEKAYLAGFIDGEGSISIYHYKYDSGIHGIHYRICISNSNLEVLEWIRDILQVRDNISVKKHTNPNWKTAYQLAIQKIGSVYEVLFNIEPYLRVKKEQALLALAFIDSHDGKSGSNLSDEEEGMLSDLAILNTRGPKKEVI